MRVLTVNLRQGGNIRNVVPLVKRLHEEKADTLVFTEFRANNAGVLLLDTVEAAGYPHTLFNTDIVSNSILIASRHPWEAFPVAPSPDILLRQSFLGVRQDSIEIVGVYIPQGDDKPAVFAALLDFARDRAARGIPCVCIGDYNTGRADKDVEVHPVTNVKGWFACEEEFRQLETLFTDAWRHENGNAREYSRVVTLYKNKTLRRGWRIDHAFVSPALLPDVRGTMYKHDVRESNLSDHSPLLIDLQ